jgi:hypothetical protein
MVVDIVALGSFASKVFGVTPIRLLSLKHIYVSFVTRVGELLLLG